MKASEIRQMAAVMDRHFWFRGTRRVILNWANDAVGGGLEKLRVADVGCGPGTTLSWLSHLPRIVGIDRAALCLELARERAPNAELIQANAEELPLKDQQFDLIFCLDILEHLEHPEKAVEELYRILKPGGILISTVPAWQFLWSEHDVALGHHRRYRKKAFKNLLQGGGFEVPRISYYNFFLFPPIASVRVAQRLIGSKTVEEGDAASSDVKVMPRAINGLLESVLGGERHLLRHINLPFGVSLIATGQRPFDGPGKE
ncbi:MAG: hypothetical protein CMH54_13335 [Myxococcales bacterium]|nr:hypothetical protein [Myxococcales bacterium]